MIIVTFVSEMLLMILFSGLLVLMCTKKYSSHIPHIIYYPWLTYLPQRLE